MSARPISEREWFKGAQEQAEQWYKSGIEAARARVLAAHREHERALDELGDLCRRRAEMRESFARMWGDQ